ncbi:arylacetamide deacetylase-like 2 [Prionailurus iriomotensis]
MATLLENMGLISYAELFSMLLKLDHTVLISDENITVMDTKFTDIPVCLYLPKKKSESQRRAVIFIHGGAFVMGSCRQTAYDFLNRWTANKLGAVVVGIELAPQYQFPVPLEDVISVVRFFLQDNILAKYGVDPSRICISGDSSGGTLAAKVTQLHGPILSRDMAIKMGCLYLTKDKALPQAVRENQHMPHGSRHLFKKSINSLSHCEETGERDIMGFKALCNIEEYWKVIALFTVAKTCTFMDMCFENLGIMKHGDLISMIFSLDYTQPLSDENVTVTDTKFVDTPVRLYLPKRKSEIRRPAVIYIHGGGFCFGSFKQNAYDSLNRWTANKLNAVVVGLDYRLAPQHHFPAQFEDSFTAVKFFLQDKILRKYGVDPTRICLSGDSSGGNLAAAVTQQGYRLAPKYHFPNQFEDVCNALKWFLHQDVLDKYGVDPERIGIPGDSAGGNLAAAVTQQVCPSPWL